MQKGISAVIATILMLMIVIALAGSAYMFISGVFTARVAQAFSIVDSYNDTIIIRNDGTESITSFSSVTVNGVPAELGFELRKVLLASPYTASQAESYCRDNFGPGWHLYFPRSPRDLDYAWKIAHSGADQSSTYLHILAIYPKTQGATCVYTAFTSESCTSWRARDDGKFWVSTRTDISEPNGDNCVDGSMGYWWNADGTISWYNDISCPGYASNRFICEKDEIKPGEIITVKILNPLTAGTHTLRLCTPSMCATGYLTIR